MRDLIVSVSEHHLSFLLLMRWCRGVRFCCSHSRYGSKAYIYIYELTDSAVLGGVAEVVSSNPSWAIKIFFSIFRHS